MGKIQSSFLGILSILLTRGHPVYIKSANEKAIKPSANKSTDMNQLIRDNAGLKIITDKKANYTSFKSVDSKTNFMLKYKPIQLHPQEYAKVMHALNEYVTRNHLENIKNKIFYKAVGNYIYSFYINEFNEYVIIGKRQI